VIAAAFLGVENPNLPMLEGGLFEKYGERNTCSDAFSQPKPRMPELEP